MGIQEEEQTPIASTSKLPPPPPSTTAPKPSDPYANYSTAESLGFKDDVAEKKREEMDLRRKEGVIGEWQKVAPKKKLPPSTIPTGGILPVGVRPNAIKEEEGVGQGSVKTEEEGEESKPKLLTEFSEEQTEQKRKGYFTEKSYNPDEDDFDPTKIVPGGGSIKLKRKRLTLKEEEELEKKRKEREEAMVPIRGIDDVQRRGTGNGAGGWASAEIEEEPMLEFGEQKPKLESEEEEKKVDVSPAVTEGASGGGGTGFKKRKMHGAGTVRKK